MELKSYPESFCKVDVCAIPALKPFFADPLKQKTPTDGVGVSQNLHRYLGEIDHEMMDLYLRKVCKTVAEILKRQRGQSVLVWG